MFSKLPSNLNEFYNSVLSESLVSLKLNTYLDNFDKETFNADGVDRSLEFNTNERVFYFHWFFVHHSELFKSYQILEGAYSKLLYLYLIVYRMAGHHSVKLELDWHSKDDEYKNYKKL